ncbi:hypothetical protein MYX82_01645, partial [Acidobacteria bacterium AH-259-D05]|nr:hypothetical protein [Acidobacteria bacterium AH-259-D05]
MSTAASFANFRLEFDPRLMEEAVMLRSAGHPQEAEFRRSRNPIYGMRDAEERDAQFQQFHQRWFVRLDLGGNVMTALREQPLLMRNTRGCHVTYVPLQKAEGADLHGSSPRTIVLKLRPASLLEDSFLLGFLRHEFMHLADLLDPSFAYEANLPKSDTGPAHDNLIQERYRVLWDAWIDGRLLGRGWARKEVGQERLAEFKAAFPMLGESSEKIFSTWFEAPFHSHNDLLTFALNPEPAGLEQTPEWSKTGRCPLCLFPSFDLQDGRDLPSQTLQEIRGDFLHWRPHEGLCRQCKDLYESR